MTFTAIFDDAEVPELRAVLDRAMNTWGEHNYPDWLQSLSDQVDQKLGHVVVTPEKK